MRGWMNDNGGWGWTERMIVSEIRRIYTELKEILSRTTSATVRTNDDRLDDLSVSTELKAWKSKSGFISC